MGVVSVARPQWPQRPATDQRCVGYLWIPADEVFLPAVEEVVRGALLVAGPTSERTPELVALVRGLAEELLAVAADERCWLIELETDDTDVFVRLWAALDGEGSSTDLVLPAELIGDLDRLTGSYDIHQDPDEILAVLQLELRG